MGAGGENKHIDILLGVPGLNPVEAIVEGRKNEIPEAGYLLIAAVTPGELEGRVRIHCYSREEPINFSDPTDFRDRYGLMTTYVSLHGRADTTVLVGGAETTLGNYSAAGGSLPADVSSTAEPLADGHIVVRQIRPYQYPRQINLGVRLFDSNPYAGRYRVTDEPILQLSRIATTQEEVSSAMEQIGRGMGMDDDQLSVFLTATRNAVEELPSQVPSEEVSTEERLGRIQRVQQRLRALIRKSLG